MSYIVKASEANGSKAFFEFGNPTLAARRMIMRTMTDKLCHDIHRSVKSELADRQSMTEEEKRLLCESLPTGRFVVFESHRLGSHLATEDRHWYSDDDKFYQHRMLIAFRSLCKRGYVKHLTLCIFELSRSGMAAASRLVGEFPRADVA